MCPLLSIFKKNPYSKPRFLTISIFETKFDLFLWTRTFSKKIIIFMHLLALFNEQKLKDIFRV